MGTNNKKINPRRKPATVADIERAKTRAQGEAIKYAFAIFFTVMWDKEQADKETMQRIWREVDELSDSVSAGYVTVADLMNTLKEEYGVCLK